MRATGGGGTGPPPLAASWSSSRTERGGLPSGRRGARGGDSPHTAATQGEREGNVGRLRTGMRWVQTRGEAHCLKGWGTAARTPPAAHRFSAWGRGAGLLLLPGGRGGGVPQHRLGEVTGMRGGQPAALTPSPGESTRASFNPGAIPSEEDLAGGNRWHRTATTGGKLEFFSDREGRTALWTARCQRWGQPPHRRDPRGEGGQRRAAPDGNAMGPNQR